MNRREALEDSLEKLFSTWKEDTGQDDANTEPAAAPELSLEQLDLASPERPEEAPDPLVGRSQSTLVESQPSSRNTAGSAGRTTIRVPLEVQNRNPTIVEEPVVACSVTKVKDKKIRRNLAEPLSKTQPSTTRAFVNPNGNKKQLVVFKLGREHYGVNIAAVAEIIRPQPITVVPRAPAFVEGVTNLRGSVLPVIDLRKRFGLPFQEITKETRIVVAEMDDTLVGMVVDAVTEVLRVPAADVEPPSPIVTTVDSAFITGVAKVGGPSPEPDEGRLIILLDLSVVLSSGEKTAEQSQEGREIPLWPYSGRDLSRITQIL